MMDKVEVAREQCPFLPRWPCTTH